MDLNFFYKRKKLVGIISITILLVLIIVALIQWGLVKNPFLKSSYQNEEVSISDNCAVIVGKLIHPIPDEDICKNRCRDACTIRQKSLIDSKFTLNENDCNDCICNCK